MVWFDCEMHFWNTCTFAWENLLVKGLTEPSVYFYNAEEREKFHVAVLIARSFSM